MRELVTDVECRLSGSLSAVSQLTPANDPAANCSTALLLTRTAGGVKACPAANVTVEAKTTGPVNVELPVTVSDASVLAPALTSANVDGPLTRRPPVEIVRPPVEIVSACGRPLISAVSTAMISA